MKYPTFKPNATIGVTAPSSGVEASFHDYLKESQTRLERDGFKVVMGDTPWTQVKAKSAPAKIRANELQKMMEDLEIDLIFPPWGGELLIEILDKLDFSKFPPKWILGYSDLSTLLLAVTLKTGIATAQGPNLIEMRGQSSDVTTAMWKEVLSTKAGESVIQYASQKYQKYWRFDEPTPCIFHLTEPTAWKTISGRDVEIEGRLLGGCVDVIQHLVGTPYGAVETFSKAFTKGEPIIWHFEVYDLDTTALRRSLVQMKYAGWFDHCTGILFGRGKTMAISDYQMTDVYRELAQELNVPVVYDIDCGHFPPQVTLINGAFAKVVVNVNEKSITQTFI